VKHSATKLSQQGTVLLTRVYIRATDGAWELLSSAQLTPPQ
jgi:hypothetical protein